MFVAGKDGQYKDIYPSILATYAAMKYANDIILNVLILWSRQTDEAYGVREFKAKFGVSWLSMVAFYAYYIHFYIK